MGEGGKVHFAIEGKSFRRMVHPEISHKDGPHPTFLGSMHV